MALQKNVALFVQLDMAQNLFYRDEEKLVTKRKGA